MPVGVELDPVTRIEGHLAVKLEVEDNKVAKAYCSGEMFRGFENILRGRHPMDAQQITQRICGVCPISHGMASIFAQDHAYGAKPPSNGRVVRNLILAANYIQSHIVHFYVLSALDFVDITAILQYQGRDAALTGLKQWVKSQIASKTLYPAAPFLPRYEGQYLTDTDINVGAIRHYLEALEMRALAHQAVALFAGKVPHSTALVPGGVTERVTAGKIAAYGDILDQLRSFIDHTYLPDVVAVAQAFRDYFAVGKGCGDFMAFGVFPQASGSGYLPGGVLRQGAAEALKIEAITEETGTSLFSSPTGLHPSKGQTTPQPDKPGAYTWLKAPRYDGRPMEVGPLARLLVANQAGHAQVKPMLAKLLQDLGLQAKDLDSVMGRHAARALECKIVADQAAQWLEELRPGEPTFADFQIPKECAGVGLVEAPRGALGHWISVSGGKVANYQCVVPSTWNCSPRDDRGVAGPVEQSLVGTPIADPKNPLEAARVVRSFDPCLACAVH